MDALPQDHEDQLQLGVRIITSSFHNKVQSLEQEIRGLGMQCDEAKGNASALQKKSSALEHELVESHQRCQQLSDENKELFKTVGALRKQIGRLDSLKTAVMSHIQDDHARGNEIGDTKALMSDEYVRSAAPLTSREMGLVPVVDSRRAGQSINASLSSSFPQIHEPMLPAVSTAGAGQGRAKSPVIDGKAFFRQARSQLSYEAFNLFLASIKRLNSQQQTREETLDEAKCIFGDGLHELYKDFESLLNRNGL